MTRPVHVVGLGTYLPERVLSNAELSRMVDTNDEWILSRTGIRERRISPPEFRNSTLATAAAKAALAESGLSAKDLQIVVLGTASPDMPFPSTACFVAANLGASGVAALDLSAACSGFIYSMSIVSQYLSAGTLDCGMAIGSELLSKIVDYTDRGTCILFGDGAGAAVLATRGKGPLVLDTLIRAGDTDRWEALCLPAGGTYLPASQQTVANRQHYIQLQGREVFKLAITRIMESHDVTMRRNHLKVSDIGLLVPHQMNRRIIEACAQRLGLPMGRVMVNIEQCGNTSSASIPLALDEARRTGRIQPGGTVLLVTFGGGFTWGTAVLQWEKMGR